MLYRRMQGYQLANVSWWYEMPESQGASAVHTDKVHEYQLGEFIRELRSVADATGRVIHIEIV